MGATPLLLLPGTLCDDRVWAPVRQAWRSAGDPCHGLIRTAVPSGHRSVPAMASALLDLMPQRCAVAGFSLGGIVALEMAAQAPDRVLGLALVASNARPLAPEGADQRRAAVERARQTGLDFHVRDELLGRYFSPARRHDGALDELVCRMAIDSGIDTYLDQAEMAISRPDSRPRLGGIRVPTLVVGGDEDVINPADSQAEMAHALQDVVWRQLKDAGHFVPLEQPVVLAGLMATWLRRVTAAGHSIGA